MYKNYIRNQYNKCSTPEDTIRRIKEGINNMGLDIEFSLYKISDYIYWSKIKCESLGLSVAGKGSSKKMCEASCYAELAERLSYPKQMKTLRESKRITEEYIKFITYEWVDGHTEDNLVNAYSIMNDAYKKIPLIDIDHLSGTNGLAAGNTIEEAIVQASCEIYERYIYINTIISEKQYPTIDINSIDNDIIKNSIKFYNDNNVDVIIKDMSIGSLPCYGILFKNNNISDDSVLYRRLVLGVSFNPEEALIRCLTERMQGNYDVTGDRYYEGSQVRDDVDNYFLLFRRGICEKSLSFLDGGKIIPLPKIDKPQGILDEINIFKDMCNSDYMVVDLTRQALNFPVVRVVMPGLSDIIPLYMPHRKEEQRWVDRRLGKNE